MSLVCGDEGNPLHLVSARCSNGRSSISSCGRTTVETRGITASSTRTSGGTRASTGVASNSHLGTESGTRRGTLVHSAVTLGRRDCWTQQRALRCESPRTQGGGNARNDVNHAGNGSGNGNNGVVGLDTSAFVGGTNLEQGVALRNQEESLSLKDVDELRRRREQLRRGIDTSVARITQLRLLTQELRSNQKNAVNDGSGAGTIKTGEAVVGVEIQDCDVVTAREEALLFLQAAEEEYVELRLQLTLASAALSAVPQTLWADIRRFRQPPPAVAAVMDAVLVLLGLPRTRHMKAKFGNERWPKLPQQLITCEPLSAYQSIMKCAEREPWMDGDSCMEELEQFLCQWTYLRVSRVHPTLGPLYHWVKAMIDASRAAGRLKALTDALNPTNITTVTDEAALLRELKENEEYVHLAQEEIMAIDSLVIDVVAAEAKGYGCTRVNPGPVHSLVGPAVGGVRERTHPAKAPGNPTAGGLGVPHHVSKTTSWKRAVPANSSTIFSAGDKQDTTSEGAASPSDPVAESACGHHLCVSSAHEVVQESHSLRDRFERLRASPLCKTKSTNLGSHLGKDGACDGFRHLVEVENCVASTNPSGTTHVPHDRERLLLRVRQLEGQLNDICCSKPEEVELMLMRDELCATLEEVDKLRAERDDLQRRIKLHEVQHSPPSRQQVEAGERLYEGVTKMDGDASSRLAPGEIMTIMVLERQLRAAHARIQHLESVMMGATSDDGTCCTSMSGSGNDSPGTPLDAAGRPSTLPAINPDPHAGNLGEIVLLQRRVEEMQQLLDAQRRAAIDAEERLNNEMHAKNEAHQRERQLQAELHSVWRKLENTEYQLKLAAEGSRCYYCCSSANSHDAEDIRSQLLQRQREAMCEGEIERLRMQLREQKQRSAEGRRRRLEVRRARNALLLKLEKTLKEVLLRQEG